MLQNTLQIIKKIVDETIHDDDKKEKLIEFLSDYRPEAFVYPGAINRALNIPITDIYDVLNRMEKEKILKHYYDIVCSCTKAVGEIYESIDEIPEYVYCENCNKNVVAISHAYLIYMVNENV